MSSSGLRGLVLGLVLFFAAAPHTAQSAAASWFVEVTEAAGVAHPHGQRSFDNPYAAIMEGYTAMGAAVAVGDVDGDGLEDLFVTDSAVEGRNRLYRNRGGLRFEDIAGAAGVALGNDTRNATSDALFFDADNDGDQDLLVVRFGRSQLFRNDGHASFAEVDALAAGLPHRANSMAAIAFDADNDGDLDLLLGNYFQDVDLFDPPSPRFFPESFESADNGGGVTLLRNEGGLRFTDVTDAAGLRQSGWVLDLGHADADLDGDEDLYVACDFGTDRFFENRGDGTFADVSARAIGVDTKKGMNADWGDFDNDGLFDLYVTNITDEYMDEGNFLWQNQGDLSFVDVARETGTHDTGWGWAGKWFDADDDGWLDLYVVDGWVSAGEDSYILDIFEILVDPSVDLTDARNWPPMGDKTLSGYQHNAFFHNQGGAVFREEAARHGLDSLADGRGVAVADLDLDGRLDLFVTNAKANPHLFRNRRPEGRRWLALELEGTRSNRDAVGARATIELAAGRRVSFVDGGNGFASQSSRRLHFGLGDERSVRNLEVHWPSGLRQRFADVLADGLYRLREGERELRPAGGGAAILEIVDRPVVAPSSGTPTDEVPAAGRGAAVASDPAAAVAALEAALRAAPDDLQTGAEYRQAVIAAGDYERALAVFAELVAAHPRSTNLRLNQAYALVDKIPSVGAVTAVILANQALTHFSAALEIEETWLGRYSRGNSYVYWPRIFGRTQLAIADLQRAIELAAELPSRRYHALAHVALGDAYWRLEDLAQATNIWRAALERYPETPELEERLALGGPELEAMLDAHYQVGTRVATDLRALWADE